MSGDTYDPRKTFGAAVTLEAEHDERVVVLSADSGGSSGLGDFRKRFPARYLEFGIEEQGVTGVASGLATTGKVPVFCAIAPFVTCRNFEQFRNDLGYMKQNVKVVGRNGGFTYSDLGSTHHSLEDYALMRMIPGVTVLAPQDAGEIRGAVRAMLQHRGPVYMRIGSGPVPQHFPDDDFVIGKGRHLRRGSDVTVISTGYTSVAVMEAVDALIAGGLSIDLLGLGTVAPLDDELVLESARRTSHVITVEEHYPQGGLGGAVAELLSSSLPVIVDRVAVPHLYVPSGPYPELLRAYGLDAAGLESRIRELVDQHRAVGAAGMP
jgi:transketolase